MQIPERLVPIGFISKPHGFKGEVLIVMDQPVSDLKKIKWIFLEISGGPVPFLTERISFSRNSAIVKFEDVNNESVAGELSGLRAFIEENKNTITIAGKIAEKNVEGYMVVDKKTGEIGKVDHVLEMAHQSLLAVIRDGKEILIPFQKPILQKTDREKKMIYVNLPEGLLDIF